MHPSIMDIFHEAGGGDDGMRKDGTLHERFEDATRMNPLEVTEDERETFPRTPGEYMPRDYKYDSDA